ncbi:MAG: hypothetical protein ACI9EF_000038 [Pseudohongiellaceae bacterium]|jgi:hypothetical protein
MSAAAMGRGPWMVILLACLVGCETTGDDARVLQVLNQRGFGRPTQDANRQYYLGIGDRVVIRAPDFKEYSGQSEAIRMDGTVTLADVGEIYLNGLTPDEATQVVQEHYSHLVLDVDSFIVVVTSITSKQYYVTGVPPYKPQRVKFEGDTLLFDALISAIQDENLVDTDKIMVLRGDPENPLQIACDYNAIRSEGLTRDNILIRENDIIYLTPSWIGYIAWFVTKLTAPLTPIRDLLTGANQTVSTVNSFGQLGNNNNNNNNNKFNQFN